MTVTTHSAEETEHIGRKIATTLHGGDIALLSGDLGAGKTTLVKGIAAGLGITDDIVSPTFTLMNVYTITKKTLAKNPSDIRQLLHVDTYRLEHEQDLVDIGIEDYIGQHDTVCIIEWPEKIPGLLHGKTYKTITLTHGRGDERIFEYTE